MDKPINIGGQAVIEGVMIRSLNHNVVAVRAKGGIRVKKDKIPPRQGRFYKLPIIRGFYNLIDMMVLGMKSIMWSADQQTEQNEKISKKEMTLTVIISIFFAIGLFVALPYALTYLGGFEEASEPFLFNLVDGIIRIGIFLCYLVAISMMKDVKILFQYHGAEHMAIHCYEHSKKLTVSNVAKFTTLHPRCGTAFIMIVLVVAILVFSILTPILFYLFPGLVTMHWLPQKILLFFTRILFLPFIAGISYEFLKYSAKFEKNPLMKIFIFPGLLMQKITTRKPTNKQIEVAIHAVLTTLKLEKAKAP
mgnify:CR=1 FL=1